MDPNSTPVDSFEIQIGNIGLGAWDLIGIFGGVPIFAWIAFGFVTRNKRCARFEEQLNESNSRDELEQVALRWEYSLMLRLLGPHQGIRLERLRSELDDKFENAELLMAAEDFEPMTEVEQAPLVEAEQKNCRTIINCLKRKMHSFFITYIVTKYIAFYFCHPCVSFGPSFSLFLLGLRTGLRY